MSFGVPSALVQGENTTAVGFDPIPLKNENGARLAIPSAEMVETSAMGRGRTQERRVLKFSRRSRSRRHQGMKTIIAAHGASLTALPRFFGKPAVWPAPNHHRLPPPPTAPEPVSHGLAG